MGRLIAWGLLVTVSITAMLLFLRRAPGVEDWRRQLPAAAAAAERTGTVAAYLHALDVAWRGDEWMEGARLARLAAAKHPSDGELAVRAARALWRAGDLLAAEAALDPQRDLPEDAAAIAVRVTLLSARGEHREALALADRMEPAGGTSAADLTTVLGARLAAGRYEGLSRLIDRISEHADPNAGYPENLVAESIAGLADYFRAVGPQPLNQIAAYGAAPMPRSLVGLPTCQALINGRGPYTLLIDTGGSIALSLDREVAEELGIRSVAAASIHGIAGRDESGQAVVDELRIGEIAVRRVMTRIFDVRKAAANLFDGILGTGIFSSGRMTLDFFEGRLVVAASGTQAAAGEAVVVRIVGDAKLIAPVTIEGQPGAALLDSGADILALAPSRLKRHFPERPVYALPLPMAAGVGGGQMPELSMVPGVDVQFAGREHANIGGLGLDVLDTLLSPMMGVQCDLLIGMGLLSRMRTLTVDYPHARMWVEWNED